MIGVDYCPNGVKDCPCPGTCGEVSVYPDLLPLDLIYSLENEVWGKAKTAAQIDATDYPPTEWVINDFIPEGVTLLAGSPKIGKSVLSTDIAYAVASGKPALGTFNITNPGPVLLIALDDTSEARFKRRLREVAGTDTIPSNLVVQTHPIGRGTKAETALRVRLTNHPDTRLVIVDTLAHIKADRSGSDIYAEDVKSMQMFNRLSDAFPGVSFLIVSHTRKGEVDDPVEAITGSHGVSGSADHLLTLTGKRHSRNRVLYLSSRDVEDCRFALAFHGERLFVTSNDPDDPTLHMSQDQARIYRALAEFPDGAGAQDLQAALPDIQHIGTRLGQMAKAGDIVKTNRGAYRV